MDMPKWTNAIQVTPDTEESKKYTQTLFAVSTMYILDSYI